MCATAFLRAGIKPAPTGFIIMYVRHGLPAGGYKTRPYGGYYHVSAFRPPAGGYKTRQYRLNDIRQSISRHFSAHFVITTPPRAIHSTFSADNSPFCANKSRKGAFISRNKTIITQHYVVVCTEIMVGPHGDRRKSPRRPLSVSAQTTTTDGRLFPVHACLSLCGRV